MPIATRGRVTHHRDRRGDRWRRKSPWARALGWRTLCARLLLAATHIADRLDRVQSVDNGRPLPRRAIAEREHFAMNAITATTDGKSGRITDRSASSPPETPISESAVMRPWSRADSAPCAKSFGGKVPMPFW